MVGLETRDICNPETKEDLLECYIGSKIVQVGNVCVETGV